MDVSLGNSCFRNCMVFFFLLISAIAKAQVFPSRLTSPVWTIKVSTLVSSSEIKVKVLNDSVQIRGEWWNKVQQTSFFNIGPFQDSAVVDAGAYLVKGDKVLYFDPLFENITTLYDYSVDIGDELFITPAENMGIDSFLVRVVDKEVKFCDDGKTLRKIRLRIIQPGESGEDLIWQEGFGEISHPIIRYRCLNANCDIFYGFNQLKTSNGTFDQLSDNLCLLVNTLDYLENEKAVNVWPCPLVGEQFTISSDDAINSVFVYALSGELVATKMLTAPSVNVSLRTNNLPDGFYFVQVRLRNGQIVNRKYQVLR